MSAVGDCGVTPTIFAAYRKHGQTEFPIPSRALNAPSFAMRAVKDAQGKLNGPPKIG